MASNEWSLTLYIIFLLSPSSGSFSFSLYNVPLSFQTLTASLSPFTNPLFPPNSHLHFCPTRLTILYSVSIISKVLSLDITMNSLLHYNKYSHYSPSICLVLFLIKCRGVDRTPAIFCCTSQTHLSPKRRVREGNHIQERCFHLSFLWKKQKHSLVVGL